MNIAGIKTCRKAGFAIVLRKQLWILRIKLLFQYPQKQKCTNKGERLHRKVSRVMQHKRRALTDYMLWIELLNIQRLHKHQQSGGYIAYEVIFRLIYVMHQNFSGKTEGKRTEKSGR